AHLSGSNAESLYWFHLAIPSLKKAITPKKTKYLIHPDHVPNFRYPEGLLFLHRFLLFLYDTRQESDGPTIIVLRYTNREYSPSSEDTYAQNDSEQSSPFYLFAVSPLMHLLKVAYAQTIG